MKKRNKEILYSNTYSNIYIYENWIYSYKYIYTYIYIESLKTQIIIYRYNIKT